MKDYALGTWANLIGWRTDEKLVVLESDDWGAIRVPNLGVRAALEKHGISMQSSKFDQLDCLESGEDLELLFDVLANHAGTDGETAKMTFNTVMGNPDFDKIRADRFCKFHHELLFDSYVRYHGTDLRSLWQSGIDAGLVCPQFHAREHLNSDLWLSDLRAGLKYTRTAFDYGYFGVRAGTSSTIQKNYLAAFWAETSDELVQMSSILDEGLKLFKRTFGFSSMSFVPCNYVFPAELESNLTRQSVSLVQGQRGQPVPQLNRGGRLAMKRRYTGQSNRTGQQYSVRNVLFEPYDGLESDCVARALRQIAQSFYLRKPAIVTTHRINFVSGLSVKNRDSSLVLLNELLTQITKTWPGVKFITSDMLARRMRAGPK